MARFTTADVVRAIIGSSCINPTTDELFDALYAGASRDDDEAAIAAVMRAVEDGRVELWDDDEHGITATLTPLAAHEQQVEMTFRPRPERDPAKRKKELPLLVPRWKPVHEREWSNRSTPPEQDPVDPTDPRFRGHAGLRQSDFAVDDPRYDPDSPDLRLLMDRHSSERDREPWEVDPSRPPQMTLILGLMPPWPLPLRADGPCPGCGGARLPWYAYCAACHRSGIDKFLPSLERVRTRKSYAGAGGKLKGGVGA